MAERASIADLRERIEVLTGSPQGTRERLSAPLLPAGIPRGALVELTGPARLEWLIAFLREHPTPRVFWIERGFTVLPTAIEQRGVSLERIVFAQGEGDEIFKAVSKALRSQAFEFVVAPGVFEQEKALKALQLLSEKAGACVFLLSARFRSAWQLAVQLRIARDREGALALSVHKHKGIA